MIKLDPSCITERMELTFSSVELEREFTSEDLEEAANFCIDLKGRVRLALGIVDMGGSEDLNFVPRERYEIQIGPWNAHSYYVEISLPNPANDISYGQIREAFLTEIGLRLERINRRLLQRIRRQTTED